MFGSKSGTTSAEFHARIFLWEHDGLEVLCVWSDDFMDTSDKGRRLVSEWAHEHLCEYSSAPELRQDFGLPATGDYQVVFKGQMEGWSSWTDCGEEYDEAMHIIESKHEPIPPAFTTQWFRLDGMDALK